MLEGAESKPCLHAPSPNCSVCGVRVFPEDPFAWVCMGRTTLASLAPCHVGSLLAYEDEGLGAASQIRLSLAHSRAMAHVLPVPLVVATAMAGPFLSYFDSPVHPCRVGVRGNYYLHRRAWDRYVISTELMREGESSARAAAPER